MPDRVFIDKQTPTVFQALTATAAEIRTRAREIGLDRVLLELVNIRVSQLNARTFRLDRHTHLVRLFHLGLDVLGRRGFRGRLVGRVERSVVGMSGRVARRGLTSGLPQIPA